MAENKYDITVRALVNADEVKPIGDNVQEMYVQRFDNMDTHELNRWIRSTMTECNIDINNHPDLFPEVNEWDIVRMFSGITETLSALEKEHSSESVALKILNAYITVQIVYPQEELI